MGAFLWCLVILLISIQQIVARDCSHVDSISNCNECIQCGAFWCNNPVPQDLSSSHCSKDVQSLDWCLDDLTSKEVLNVTGKSVSPKSITKTISVGIPLRIPINISGTEMKVLTKLSDERKGFSVTNKIICENNKCQHTIEALATPELCAQSTVVEPVTAVVVVDGASDEVLVTYHVSCTCECSNTVQQSSDFCTNKGNYSCGVCYCDDNWSGDYCEESCEKERGDMSTKCMNDAKPHIPCSGNGICGPCQTCKCFNHGEGSQYFDSEFQCLDICTNINFFCDECLRDFYIGHNTFGACTQSCNYPLSIVPCNETLLEEKNSYNRNIWVDCNDTLDNTFVKYAAMRTGNEIVVMDISSCKTSDSLGAITKVNVPVILGVLALVCVAAAVAGFALWKKHMGTPPLSAAEIHNIDAEGTTGRNPLYRPPTSFFKNPTYGKL